MRSLQKTPSQLALPVAHEAVRLVFSHAKAGARSRRAEAGRERGGRGEWGEKGDSGYGEEVRGEAVRLAFSNAMV